MEALCTSTRDDPPAHLIFKIESFSTLASSSLEKYDSCVFDASGCKWRLVVYPNGNKAKGAEDHISLYLASVDTCTQVPRVTLSLFVYDHIRDKYLYAQDVIQNQVIKPLMGFDKFLPLKKFIDPLNGYLADDACVFGAEVFLTKKEAQGQCLSMMPKIPVPCKFIWTIENFSKLENKGHCSRSFITRCHNWKVLLYPKGHGSEAGKSVSLYLRLADSITAGREVVVDMKLRIVDQLKGNHQVKGFTVTINSTTLNQGWLAFLSLKDLNKSTAGYLVKDTCIIEAEVTVLGSAKMWER